MPPKKQEPSKKAEAKKKEKIIEDKTFGMKNKKGAKQQKYIQTVQQQVSQTGRSAKQTEKDKMSKKEEKKKAIEELNMLFRPVEQKIAKGTDPKSVLCAFFKVGQCTKGDKCKFSHDLAVERKIEKRSLYEDIREDTGDNMDNWDEAKLAEVIHKKHGEQEKVKPKTAIVCKYFLEAVESSKYGWFWACPNGDGCIYRHCLPPGFVLKKDKKKEEKGESISLEDLIERERAALSSQDLTRVTLETFLKWKEQKKREKVKTAMDAKEKKKSNFAAGKFLGISGRELFEFNPDLIRGDDDEADEGSVYNREEDEENNSEGSIRETNWHIIPLYRSDLSTKCFYGRFAPHRDIDLTNCEVEIEEEDESDPQTSGTNGKCPDNAKKPHSFVMNVKDGDEQKRFRATRNLGNQSHYVAFEIEESRATVYPVDGWYDFKPIVDCDVLTYEEVEEVFKMKNKVLNNFAVNSAMKRKREEIGATMDCEPKSKKAKKPNLADDPANDSDDYVKGRGRRGRRGQRAER